jgi:hypothetical protein
MAAFSGGINMVSMRSLSSHFAFSGGSFFIARRITLGASSQPTALGTIRYTVPWTFTVWPGSTFPEMGHTQYRWVDKLNEASLNLETRRAHLGSGYLDLERYRIDIWVCDV